MTAQEIAAAFDSGIEVLCQQCHRPLRELGSRALRLGPVCRRGIRDLHPTAPGQLALDLDLTHPEN